MRRRRTGTGHRLRSLPKHDSRLIARKSAYIDDGTLADVTPSPGHTYTRDTWPPRSRGRSESLTSPRRIAAKLRISEIIQLRGQGFTWAQIAAKLGYYDASGPYRLVQRFITRMDYERDQKARRKKKR